MKEVDKRRTPNTNNRTKPRVAKTEKKNPKPNQTTNGKASNVKDGGSKESRGKPESIAVVSESNTATEQSEVYEDLVIHYVDDLNRSQEVSDSETIKDSVSSQGSVMEDKAEESVSKNDSTENDSQESKEKPGSDDESEQNVEEQEKESVLEKKIEEMEARIEKLEEELREVAALEIALYSVVPEHGSSAHKVHTPARRLSRIHIHACKYWSQQRRATVAKNTVSGLLLVAKSCGNDVARLTFWLSNTVVLREIISQTFGGSRHSNGHGKPSDMRSSTIKWKAGPSSKDINGLNRLSEDWQETGTFIAALERVESWIFFRVVESVWWQALTPHMQSPMDDASNSKNAGRISGPALGDQKQGNFSISLWKNAFQDAAQRLCPVRASGHECGCLPALARMLMEQCIARLDVAMFNAILRESAQEIPTDPVSDPIVDSRVLPIPAGDLSFGSGAQLKNSIGNWSRWLTDMFGMDADDAPQEAEEQGEESNVQGKKGKSKSFLLLNALSDLLMLPKDLLMDRSIRKEVCPSISLPLVKRILCNFTPDEFCPDPVPGAVLEALNAESIVERKMSGISTRGFPYTVESVVYTPPSPADVAEKCAVSDAIDKSELARNVSVVQRKGYTSDEELEELESPLSSIVDKLPSSPNVTEKGAGKRSENATNERYELLSEVWSV